MLEGCASAFALYVPSSAGPPRASIALRRARRARLRAYAPPYCSSSMSNRPSSIDGAATSASSPKRAAARWASAARALGWRRPRHHAHADDAGGRPASEFDQQSRRRTANAERHDDRVGRRILASELVGKLHAAGRGRARRADYCRRGNPATRPARRIGPARIIAVAGERAASRSRRPRRAAGGAIRRAPPAAR